MFLEVVGHRAHQLVLLALPLGSFKYSLQVTFFGLFGGKNIGEDVATAPASRRDIPGSLLIYGHKGGLLRYRQPETVFLQCRPHAQSVRCQLDLLFRCFKGGRYVIGYCLFIRPNCDRECF